MEESIKQRIAIFLSAFQYGITLFLGAGTGLITYLDKHPSFDTIYAFLMAIMIVSLSIAIPCIIEADKNATLLQKFPNTSNK
jgi:hypothetical protein